MLNKVEKLEKQTYVCIRNHKIRIIKIFPLIYSLSKRIETTKSFFNNISNCETFILPSEFTGI